MKYIAISLAFLGSASSFTMPPKLQETRSSLQQCAMTLDETNDGTERAVARTRREALVGMTALVTPALAMGVQPALAIPMISIDEFYLLLRDAALSVEVVEFSGPKSETVTIRLVDGTLIGIKDVIESPSDPRSPLKVAAECRENGVKTKFLNLESILANAPKRKKMYTNQRVQDAYEKERAKQERIRLDEEERLAALRQIEAQEREAAEAAASAQ